MPRHRVPMTTLGTDQSQFNSGPFQKLHNLAIREQHMVEPLPGRSLVANNYGSSGYTARRMWPLGEQDTAYEMVLLRSAGDTFELRTLLESGTDAPSIADATLLGATCGLTEARQRPIYAGPRGVLVFEDDADETRMLGMLPPTFIAVASSTTTNAQAVPVNSRVAWRATLHRKHADDYEITSAPSYAIYAETAGAVRDFTIRIGWLDLAPISDERVREGDILRLWRARAVASGTSTNDRYLLTAEVELSASNISNRYVEIRDVTPDEALAATEELYTNPGMQGAKQANWQLGASGDVAVYNGHAFYAERSLPAYLETRIAAHVGALSGATAYRTYGIGQRLVTGDTTLGSPIITNVSDTTGIVQGQALVNASTAAFPFGTIVASVGVNTITMASNATLTDVLTTFYFADTVVVTIDGGTPVRARFANLLTLLFDLWDNNVQTIPTVNVVVPGEDYSLSTGVPFATVRIVGGLTLRLDVVAPYGVDASDIVFEPTNSGNYSPPVASAEGTTDERLNRVKWSKLDQPEHVPAGNELVVGKAEIVRFVSTQDRLFVFCTDGTYVISGNGGAWSVDTFDQNLVISNQAAADTMDGNVYVYAKRRGLLRIDPGGGVTGLTKGAIQRALDALWDGLTDVDVVEVHVACDELHNEIGLFMRQPAGGESADVAEEVYIFNERTACWRTQTPGVAEAGTAAVEAWCWSPRRRSLVWSQGGTASNPDAYSNLPDTDLTTPIPGATLQTYPIVPDGDATAVKRFHEAVFTISCTNSIIPTGLVYTVSASARASGETTSEATSLPGNPTPDPDVPAFYQLRHMVSRQCTLSPNLVLNFAPDAENTLAWRLHAIEVAWEPASSRSYSR